MRHNGNRNHPQKGSSLTIEPLTPEQVERVKSVLVAHPRNLAMFALGISTSLTASELLGLQWCDIDEEARVVIHPSGNVPIPADVMALLLDLPRTSAEDVMFPSGRGGGVINIPAFTNMVKAWCHRAGLPGNYGAQTLRKTYLAAQEVRAVDEAVMKERQRCASIARGSGEYPGNLACGLSLREWVARRIEGTL